MKVKLYDEATPTEEKEITLRLLRPFTKGPVAVCVVDDKGELKDSGILIEFNGDMTFKVLPYVNSELGLPLGKKQKLIEDKG